MPRYYVTLAPFRFDPTQEFLTDHRMQYGQGFFVRSTRPLRLRSSADFYSLTSRSSCALQHLPLRTRLGQSALYVPEALTGHLSAYSRSGDVFSLVDTLVYKSLPSFSAPTGVYQQWAATTTLSNVGTRSVLHLAGLGALSLRSTPRSRRYSTHLLASRKGDKPYPFKLFSLLLR